MVKSSQWMSSKRKRARERDEAPLPPGQRGSRWRDAHGHKGDETDEEYQQEPDGGERHKSDLDPSPPPLHEGQDQQSCRRRPNTDPLATLEN